jgi:hypothetical protein
MLNAETFLDGKDPIQLCVNYKSSGFPNQNSADFKGINLWNDGKAVYIKK